MEFLPSAIARLVLGYLKEECPGAFDSFLDTSPLLKECIPAIKKGKYFILKFEGTTLIEILEQYAKLCSTIEEHYANTNSLGNLSLLSWAEKLDFIVRNIDRSGYLSGDASVSSHSAPPETTQVQSLPGNKIDASNDQSASKMRKNVTYKDANVSTGDSFRLSQTAEENEAIQTIVQNLLVDSPNPEGVRHGSNSLAVPKQDDSRKRRLRHSKQGIGVTKSDDAIEEQNAEAIHSIITACQSTETTADGTTETNTVPIQTANNSAMKLSQQTESIELEKNTPTQQTSVCQQTNIKTSSGDVILFDGTFDKYIASDINATANINIASNGNESTAIAQKIITQPEMPKSNFYMTSSSAQVYNLPTYSSIYTEQDIMKMPTVVVCGEQKPTAGFFITQQPQQFSVQQHFPNIHIQQPQVVLPKFISIASNANEMPVNTTSSIVLCNSITTSEAKQPSVDMMTQPNVPITETPENSKITNRVRVSKSTPHSGKSHIRALDFSPKATADITKNLFKTPDLATDAPIATRSPAPKLSDGWDKVQGTALILADFEKGLVVKKNPEKLDPNTWDANLRDLVQIPVPNLPKSIKKKKKNNAKTSSKNKAPANASVDNSDKAEANDKPKSNVIADALAAALNLSNDENESGSAAVDTSNVVKDLPGAGKTKSTLRKRKRKTAVPLSTTRRKSTQMEIDQECTDNSTIVCGQRLEENLKENVQNDSTAKCGEEPVKKTPKLRRKCNIGNSSKKKMQSVQEVPTPSVKCSKEVRSLECIDDDKSKLVLSPSKFATKRSLLLDDSNKADCPVQDQESSGNQPNDCNYITPDTAKPSANNPVVMAKRNITPILDTPYKCDISSLLPFTPRFLSPVTTMDTPITRLLKEQQNGTIDLSLIPTPSFPITPGLNLTPKTQSPYANRPTDYSTSSSYYQPSEPEQNKSVEQMIEECKRIEKSAIDLKPSEPDAVVGVAEGIESYVLHEISLPEYEKRKELDKTKYGSSNAIASRTASQECGTSSSSQTTIIATKSATDDDDDDDDDVSVNRQNAEQFMPEDSDTSSSSSTCTSSSCSSEDSDTTDTSCENNGSRNTTVINVKKSQRPEESSVVTAKENSTLAIKYEKLRKELELKRQRTINSIKNDALRKERPKKDGKKIATRKKPATKKAVITKTPNAAGAAKIRRMPARDCKTPKAKKEQEIVPPKIVQPDVKPSKAKRKPPNPKKVQTLNTSLKTSVKNVEPQKATSPIRYDTEEEEVVALHLSSDEEMLAPFQVVETELLELSSASVQLENNAKPIDLVQLSDANTLRSFHNILNKIGEEKILEQKRSDEEAVKLVNCLKERGIYLLPKKSSKNCNVSESNQREEGEIFSDDETVQKKANVCNIKANDGDGKKRLSSENSTKCVQSLIDMKLNNFAEFGKELKINVVSRNSKSPAQRNTSGARKSDKDKRENSKERRNSSPRRNTSVPSAKSDKTKVQIHSVEVLNRDRLISFDDLKKDFSAKFVPVTDTVGQIFQPTPSSDIPEDYKDNFSVLQVAEGSEEYIKFVYNERNCCKKTLSDYNLEFLKKEITAKVYMEDTDNEVDKTMIITPFISIFSLNVEEPTNHGPVSVLSNLYDDSKKTRYNTGTNRYYKDRDKPVTSTPIKKPPQQIENKCKDNRYEKEVDGNKLISDNATSDDIKTSTSTSGRDMKPYEGQLEKLLSEGVKTNKNAMGNIKRRQSEEENYEGLPIVNGEIILSSKSESPGRASEDVLDLPGEDEMQRDFAIKDQIENSSEGPPKNNTSSVHSKKRKATSATGLKPEKKQKKCVKLLETLDLESFLSKVHAN